MKWLVNIGAFIAMIIIGRVWIAVDQNFLPSHLLRPVFITLIIGLLIGYFFIVDPRNWLRFAGVLSLLLLPIVIALSLIQHALIEHNFQQYWQRSIFEWCSVVAGPFLAGSAYHLLRSALFKSKQTGEVHQ